MGLVLAGLPKVGTFRRHQTVPLCLCSWQLAVAPVVIAKKRVEIAKAHPGEKAPQAIITCIEAAMRSSSYAVGMMVEQREFKKLLVGDQARAL